MGVLMRRLLAAIAIVLLAAGFAMADRDAAETLNARGYESYKQAEYGAAVDLFQRAIKADKTYGLAHYNLACTLGVLRQRGEVCDYDAYRSTITFHLEQTLKHLPEKRAKMLTDPDLKSVRDTLFFQHLRGLSPKREADIRQILVNVKWYGPSPGAYGPVGGVDFRADGTVRMWSIEIDDNPRRVACEGNFRLDGREVILTFPKGFHGKKKLTGVFKKNGALVFESLGWTMTDDPDECSA